MAIFSDPKLASRVPSFRVPGGHVPGIQVPDIHVPVIRVPRLRVPYVDGLRLRVASASATLTPARERLIRVTGYAVSPSWWWAQITSAAGVAMLLAMAVASLIGALVVTWPHR
ncbi:MAG TPA: hypothetical protein VEQ12_06700 [Candidatus Limnocylindria bacterium]|nr:hypothetical protein [Candidatus Limnocylindria bacterium]